MTETTVPLADLNTSATKVKVLGLQNTSSLSPWQLNSVYFSRECLETILGNSSCTGIRFCLIVDDLTGDGTTSLRPTLMALGEDGSLNPTGTDAYVSNKPCPPRCPKDENTATKSIDIATNGIDIDITLTTTTPT